MIYSADPLLGSAGKSWGLNSGIYFLSGNERSKTWRHVLDEIALSRLLIDAEWKLNMKEAGLKETSECGMRKDIISRIY